jgi:Domain of unknown function (DUF1874)
MIYVTNSFSLSMVNSDRYDLHVQRVGRRTVSNFLQYFSDKDKCKSVVGHESTAELLSKDLDMKIDFNRETVTLAPGDLIFVGQYKGPRLAEGATELPEGASIKWLAVDIRIS